MSLKVLYILPPTKIYAGIERVVDEVCSELAERYHTDLAIDVLYTSDFKNFEIGNRKYRKIKKLTGGRLNLMLTVRRVVSEAKYDLVVVPQVEATVIFWLACLGLRRSFALYLHGNPRLEMSHLKAKLLFFIMGRFILHRLSYVFGTSPKQLESFKAMFPSNVPHHWVPNPVRRFDGDNNEAIPDSEIVTFVNVARFSYQKGQDILLSSFAKLHKLRRNVRLRMVGYGNSEPDLRQQIKDLDLEGVVSIEFYPDNPQAALSASDVYVSPSRWEGWSLAICEALRFGLPVVATDCEFGPSDILTDQRLGRLVSLLDEDQLVSAMQYYCDNIQLEKKYSEYRKSFVDRYSVERVVHVHADALMRAAK
ncbi:alpha-mannosyltransferase [Microvirga sp. KLBC 81]|uniref:glycosyltransferase n=1 Tax=Microvirga sp. KLBC 81 TaxID=1862707 RepID=UPI000D51B7A0|nr:glycosyltransferase [Microvirga sp. KLBC 81]PVE20650.1 alpha-mannosyltransferase [Microvirga sp. KLBC 81]